MAVSKTPTFDAALDKYFAALTLDDKGGQLRACRISGKQFYVYPEDIAFYKKMRVPLPTVSPNERTRFLLAFYLGYNFFKIPSAFSHRPILALYPPTTPYKIYEHQIWWSDNWNPEDYARPYNPEQKFFSQVASLQREVPRPNLDVDKTNTNSDYTSDSGRLKNCYLVFSGWQTQDSAYCTAPTDSRNCFDSADIYNCDTCYAAFESFNCYRCHFVDFAKDCMDSWFLYDCVDCQHCFGCMNLRHKKYHFFNEPLGREEYERRLNGIHTGDRTVFAKYQKQFEEFKKKVIYRENHNERSLNSSGDFVRSSKNCKDTFYTILSEDCRYIIGNMEIRNSYDVLGGIDSEFSYYSIVRGANFGIKFSMASKSSHDIEYCDYCINCHDCFGCIGLHNKSFFILNQGYTEEEYWKKVDVIKTKMLLDGEYGEFFPQDLTPTPYNLSVAVGYVGYDNLRVARQYGYHIEEIPEYHSEVSGETIDSTDVPKDITDVQDDILDKNIHDTVNNRMFRYIKPELDFCRTHKIPLPIEHYSVRLERTRKKLGTISLDDYQDSTCDKCGKKIHSRYPAKRDIKVYCEACYREAIE